jgi:CBS domain-containing protein
MEAVPADRWPVLTAGDVMVPMALEMVANAAEPYEGVAARVGANPAGRFVVLDGGRLVGVLSCR